jgi:hypothetical protein
MPKIDINKKYKTRKGETVEILSTTRNHPTHPVVASVHKGDLQLLLPFTSNGICGSVMDYYYDLFEVKEWEDFKIDDEVIVRFNPSDSTLHKRHFAGVSEKGNPMVWYKGGTSWSCVPSDRLIVHECKKPEKEQLNRCIPE